MSTVTRLSTKGQIVLPKALRTAHRWNPGTEFIIQERD
jgi:AbrB family looped-hinge helix DNA binding protein